MMSYFRFEKTTLLLPWIGLTILTTANFVGILILHLIMFNFPAAWWLIVKEGIPALVITYLITVVYTLYLQMLEKTDLVTDPPTPGASTLYGTDSVVFVTEDSSSVVGRRPEDYPPSYDSLVQAHKQHIRT